MGSGEPFQNGVANVSLAVLSSPILVQQGQVTSTYRAQGCTGIDNLSLDVHNPEAWDFNGVEVAVTARLADLFNHPAPDGTAVAFYTEGGVIQPQCFTQGGVCSVTWTSQNPRPVNGRVTLSPGSSGLVSVCVADSRGQPMSFETNVSFSIKDVSIVNEPDYSWLNTTQSGIGCRSVRLSAADVSSAVSSALRVTVTTPAGIVTEREVTTVSVPLP